MPVFSATHSIEYSSYFQLAPYLAQLFLQWFSKGLCDSTFHLIAHSLGAELAGMVGNYVQIQSNNAHKIRHLTGLDPAQPLFFNPETYRHIRSTDAWFVDIYHTNPYSQGAPYDVGTADIWFNDPSIPQPGCDIRKNQIILRFLFSPQIFLIYIFHFFFFSFFFLFSFMILDSAAGNTDMQKGKPYIHLFPLILF